MIGKRIKRRLLRALNLHHLKRWFRSLTALFCLFHIQTGFGETSLTEPDTSPIVSAETPLQTIPSEEFRFAALVKKLNKDSQALWLVSGEERFLALYKPANGANEQGAALIISDNGHHPDWPGPVRDLRNSLPLHEWATLSLALPLQSADKNTADSALFSSLETNPKLTLRLQSAMTHMQGLGLYNIVVIAVGNAAPLTALSLIELPESSYAGFIALAPWSINDKTQAIMAESFTDLPSGVLELVPALWPKAGLVQRKGLAEKKQHPNYSQVKLLGDIKHFKDSPQLLPRIRGWLKRNAEAMEGKRQQSKDKN
ncbi:MAG: DUF3530 family protein [Pseudomonadales bacterium]|nr:DUF3530 family protein [Pseudomonadales bacterium]